MINISINVLNLFLLIHYFYISIKSNHCQSSLNNYVRHFESIENSITLMVNGPGENIEILGSSYSYLPDEILINDSPVEITKKVNLIKEGQNIIKMKWTNKLTHCRYMFKVANL